jgi:tetratricopeptide (TPR) repeat protein
MRYIVSTALLVEFYQQLPERRDKESNEEWKRRLRAATSSYKKQVAQRYSEGTLLRLLDSTDATTRRAAVLALALLGSMEANEPVVARLHDEDGEVRQLATDALWKIWFRGGGSEANNLELQRLSRVRDRQKAAAGLDRLIAKAPAFAEAYNQRAILAFSLKQYERSLADCEKALELNPYHFGAQAGIGQCYLQMRKHKSALKAFRQALRINPNLDGIAETIRALETSLGDDGRRDEKK